MSSAELRFNKQLLRRFLLLGQPYFYPVEEGGSAWCLLLASLVVGVVSATYWLAVVCAQLGLHVLPATYLPGLPEKLRLWLSWPKPLAAGASLILAGRMAQRRRRQLAGRWNRWGMLALLLFLLFCVTGLNVYLSFVFRRIDNYLVERQEAAFYESMWGYGMALVIAVPVITLYQYVRMKLARNWRSFLSLFFLERYLANRAYYRLDSNSNDTDIDNPDQRLSEDIHSFTVETLSFLLDILGGILDLLTFTAILWATSERLMGSLLAYAGVGTCIALIIGQKLVEINYQRLRKEADMRYSLIHIRDNAEAIAFYGGEAHEHSAVQERLEVVMCNYDALIWWSCAVTVYQKSFFYLARLVPYLVIGGLYFAKQVDFGTFGQGAFAFHKVLSAVTIIIERIGEISRFAAGINRLGAFYDELALAEEDTHRRRLKKHETETELNQVLGSPEELAGLVDADADADVDVEATQGAAGEIRSVVCPGAAVELSGLTLRTPTGRLLVDDLGLVLGLALAGTSDPDSAVKECQGQGQGQGQAQRAQRLLIVGPSGFGKSSVLRAIAGLWTRGAGEVRRPPAGEMLFLPQKPYMPLGDLRTQLLYPNLLTDCPDEELVATLALLGLGDLPSRFPGGLDAVQDWSRVLSGGEQQRLAAARCLVAFPAPSVLVLDEATSALPVQDEASLYGLLQGRGINYISVGHRESLLGFHDLVLEICGSGAWKLHQPGEYMYRRGGPRGPGSVGDDENPEADGGLRRRSHGQ